MDGEGEQDAYDYENGASGEGDLELGSEVEDGLQVEEQEEGGNGEEQEPVEGEAEHTEVETDGAEIQPLDGIILDEVNQQSMVDNFFSDSEGFTQF